MMVQRVRLAAAACRMPGYRGLSPYGTKLAYKVDKLYKNAPNI